MKRDSKHAGVRLNRSNKEHEDITKMKRDPKQTYVRLNRLNTSEHFDRTL